ncbi:cation diffusion facilitator family transporter [methane-oxidizing endosymbiont of Gigantopelta aegis]|uniref:cation diffusion facilitator family transporter n=1 Tax=methane-oxidizing endosymbiont of Gigantopelta aegis TaxID=2794938 RepID=UPI0018DE7CF1|nr:cation diffusion facilitator family transporter [methane-oxidizing endosymbiont of Gigantopelta aegis]
MAAVLDSEELARVKTRVTYVGAMVNVFLTLIKVGVGIWGHSAALIADGIHSLSDLLSDLVVIGAIKMGSREADYDHPYGHRRYETLATVLLGLGLVVIAGGIVWDISERLRHAEKLLLPDRNTLWVALISILANEWLYHYTKRAGLKTRSNLLIANAWHHRSDAISSVVVLIGIIGVFAGYPYADAIAAVIVALMVGKIGFTLVLQSINELVDTSLPEEQVKAIRKTIKTTHGVKDIHLLRTRQMGEDAYVDAHIVVDPRITVSEGHQIGDIVRDRLKNEFDDIQDVLVHVDPEDDEFLDKDDVLPQREEIIALFRETLGDLFEHIDEIKIHYLDGKLEIEVMLPHLILGQVKLIEQIKQHCALLERTVDKIGKINVFIKA